MEFLRKEGAKKGDADKMNPEDLALAYLSGDVKAMPQFRPAPVDLTGSVMLKPEAPPIQDSIESSLLQLDDAIPWGLAGKGLLGLGLMAGIKPITREAKLVNYLLPEIVQQAQKRVVEPVSEAAVTKFSPEVLELYKQYLASQAPATTIMVKK